MDRPSQSPPSWAIFLRGVNVGGHGKLPMKPFRMALTKRGLEDVHSYIQSGNITCRSPLSQDAIRDLVADVLDTEFALARPVHVTPPSLLKRIIDTAPTEARTAPKALMVYLHSGQADVTGLQDKAAPTEHLSLHNGYTLLWAPDGIGRSKLAAAMDSALPQPVTARNLNTILAVYARLTPDGA